MIISHPVFEMWLEIGAAIITKNYLHPNVEDFQTPFFTLIWGPLSCYDCHSLELDLLFQFLLKHWAFLAWKRVISAKGHQCIYEYEDMSSPYFEKWYFFLAFKRKNFLPKVHIGLHLQNKFEVSPKGVPTIGVRF